jgi:hypothetical protein
MGSKSETKTETTNATDNGPKDAVISDVQSAFLKACKGKNVLCEAILEKNTNTAIKQDWHAIVEIDGVPVEFFGINWTNDKGNAIAVLSMTMRPWKFDKRVTLKGSETKAQLVDLANEFCIDSSGKKDEILARLTDENGKGKLVTFYHNHPMGSYQPTTEFGKEILAVMAGEKPVEYNKNGYPDVTLNYSRTKSNPALFLRIGQNSQSIALWGKQTGTDGGEFSTEGTQRNAQAVLRM